MKKGIFLGGSTQQTPPGARAVGFARFRELLGRDLAKYALTGFIAVIAATVYGAMVWFGATGGSLAVTLGLGAVGGLLATPFLTGLIDTLLRTLRDEPGFWWSDYLTALKRNALQSMAAGALLGAVLSGQCFCLYYGLYPLLSLLALAIFMGICLYSFAQIALVRLGLFTIFRNSLMLMMAHPVLSAKAIGILAVWSLLLWLFAPLTVLFWAAAGLWLPLLLSLLQVYDMLEETFRIEEACEELQRKKYDVPDARD